MTPEEYARHLMSQPDPIEPDNYYLHLAWAMQQSSLPTIPIQGDWSAVAENQTDIHHVRRMSSADIFEEWPIGPPRCRSCGSMLRDLRRHADDCTYRQAQQRRCEEAIDAWDGPQEARGEPGTRVFSDELLARANALVQHEAQRLQEAAGGMQPLRIRRRVADLPVRIQVDTSRLEATFARLNRLLDERERELRRPSRRQRATRALRTMMQPRRSDLLDWVAITVIAIIGSILIQGAFPVYAGVGIWGLLSYVVGLHAWLGWKFWQAYRQQ